MVNHLPHQPTDKDHAAELAAMVDQVTAWMEAGCPSGRPASRPDRLAADESPPA